MTVMKRMVGGALAATLLMSLTGCGLFSGSDAHAPVDLVKVANPQVDVDIAWRVNVGESNGMLVPVVTQNAIYAAGGKTVKRLERATGKVVWSTAFKRPVVAGVGTDGLTLAVVTDDGVLHTMDPEGNILWTASLSTDTQIPPLVGNGLVVVKTADSRITAFDAGSGQRLWHYLGQVPTLTLRAYKSLAWSPAGILVGQASGRLLALNVQGQPVFDMTVADPKGITEVERLVDIVGAPWVDPQLMCASAFQGETVCMSAQNGAIAWAKPVDAVSGPVGVPMGFFVTDSSGGVHALARNTGEQIWHNNELLYRSTSTPVPFGQNVAVSDYEGVVSVMDAQTGRVIGRKSLSGAVSGEPVPYGDGALFQSVKGDLYCVLPRTMTP